VRQPPPPRRSAGPSSAALQASHEAAPWPLCCSLTAFQYQTNTHLTNPPLLTLAAAPAGAAAAFFFHEAAVPGCPAKAHTAHCLIVHDRTTTVRRTLCVHATISRLFSLARTGLSHQPSVCSPCFLRTPSIWPFIPFCIPAKPTALPTIFQRVHMLRLAYPLPETPHVPLLPIFSPTLPCAPHAPPRITMAH